MDVDNGGMTKDIDDAPSLSPSKGVANSDKANSSLVPVTAVDPTLGLQGAEIEKIDSPVPSNLKNVSLDTALPMNNIEDPSASHQKPENNENLLLFAMEMMYPSPAQETQSYTPSF
ncbi:hypothetical protein MLD38_003860 [Melastoma candidum]|uniref:Uncharacterized protein n=1 Tax=Melastoma candidum TaxID=119954 RepID=A0ACB9S5V0_9MYRT|nr:hypothetical protein MLD38_003860 [Melastoma candidum]